MVIIWTLAVYLAIITELVDRNWEFMNASLTPKILDHGDGGGIFLRELTLRIAA